MVTRLGQFIHISYMRTGCFATASEYRTRQPAIANPIDGIATWLS